jgi:predicted ATPase
MMLGYQDRAAASMRECLAYADSIDHPVSVAMAYNFAATLHQWRREPDVVRTLEDFRLAYATKHDFDLFRMLGEISRGWLAAEEGRCEEGAAQIRSGLMVYQAVGAELGRPTFLGILADVCGRLGRSEEGLVLVAEAMDLAERTGLHYWDAELQRLKGSLLLLGAGTRARAAEREAEACFLAALDVARRQAARSAELRAAVSLCRLWDGQHRREEAQALLSETYGWFTEGFVTPDLIEARTLLDQLATPRKKSGRKPP